MTNAASPHVERVALHTTRLKTPGLQLDSSGVAVGAQALVLLPTIERLVAFLSMLTRTRALSEVADGAELGALSGAEGRVDVALVKSRLGAREVIFRVPASSPAQVDGLAAVARLAGALTFTGSDRHFVQWRDAAAPFGYDACAPLITRDVDELALYHASFTQAYVRERTIDLRALVLRLELRIDPVKPSLDGAPLWVLTEPGLLRAVASTLVRANVRAHAAAIEVAPTSAIDLAPRRFGLIFIAATPARLTHLLTRTPGLRAFVPVCEGVAVEFGHMHPIHLAGMPIFSRGGLALLRAPGTGDSAPLVLDATPSGVEVASLRAPRLAQGELQRATGLAVPEAIATKMRLISAPNADRAVRAVVFASKFAPLFRRLAYALSTETIARSTLASVRDGGESLIVWRSSVSLDAPALGTPFSETAPGLFVAAGSAVEPAAAPAEIARIVGATPQSLVFMQRFAGDPLDLVRAFGVDVRAFVPLAQALLIAEQWGATPVAEVRAIAVETLDRALDEPTDSASPEAREVQMTALGLSALMVRAR